VRRGSPVSKFVASGLGLESSPEVELSAADCVSGEAVEVGATTGGCKFGFSSGPELVLGCVGWPLSVLWARSIGQMITVAKTAVAIRAAKFLRWDERALEITTFSPVERLWHNNQVPRLKHNVLLGLLASNYIRIVERVTGLLSTLVAQNVDVFGLRKISKSPRLSNNL